MKLIYRGYEIDIRREPCLAGYELLYVDIIRVKDGYHCLGFYEDSSEKVPDMMNYMRARIDDELEESDPWGEKADEN